MTEDEIRRSAADMLAYQIGLEAPKAVARLQEKVKREGARYVLAVPEQDLQEAFCRQRFRSLALPANNAITAGSGSCRAAFSSSFERTKAELIAEREIKQKHPDLVLEAGLIQKKDDSLLYNYLEGFEGVTHECLQ